MGYTEGIRGPHTCDAVLYRFVDANNPEAEHVAPCCLTRGAAISSWDRRLSARFRIGDRVKIIEDVNNFSTLSFPERFLPAGETGTLVKIIRDEFGGEVGAVDELRVQLDKYHQELDAWHNEVAIYTQDLGSNHPFTYLQLTNEIAGQEQR